MIAWVDFCSGAVAGGALTPGFFWVRKRWNRWMTGRWNVRLNGIVARFGNRALRHPRTGQVGAMATISADLRPCLGFDRPRPLATLLVCPACAQLSLGNITQEEADAAPHVNPPYVTLPLDELVAALGSEREAFFGRKEGEDAH